MTRTLDQFFSSERLSRKWTQEEEPAEAQPEVEEDGLSELYGRLREAARARFPGADAAALNAFMDRLGDLIEGGTEGSAGGAPRSEQELLELIDGIERLADALMLGRRGR